MLGRMVSNLMSWIFGVLVGCIAACTMAVGTHIIDWDEVHKLTK